MGETAFVTPSAIASDEMTAKLLLRNRHIQKDFFGSESSGDGCPKS